MSNLFRQNAAFLKEREPTYTREEIMLSGRIDPTTGEFDPNTMIDLPTGYMWVTGVGTRSSVRAVMTFVMRQVALAAGKRVRTGIIASGERVAIEPVADGQSAPIADQLQQESKKAIATPFSMVTGGRVQYAANGGLFIYVGDYAPLGWQGGNIPIDPGDVPTNPFEHSWIIPYFTGVYGEAPVYVVTTPIVSASNAGLLLSAAFAETLPDNSIRLAAVSISEGQTSITPATSRLEDLRDPLNREGGGITPGSVSGPQIVIQDRKTQNTAGGTFTSGAWRTRDLNTLITNVGSYASVSSNQVTLPDGTYLLDASGPAISVDQHQARWWNVTDGVVQQTDEGEDMLGTSEFTNGDTSQNRSHVTGRFTVSGGPKVFELQHRCSTTRATQGFGVQANFAEEVYAWVRLTKEA